MLRSKRGSTGTFIFLMIIKILYLLLAKVGVMGPVAPEIVEDKRGWSKVVAIGRRSAPSIAMSGIRDQDCVAGGRISDSSSTNVELMPSRSSYPAK
jgi:hypothetical protein